jgi:hypothetical protein
VAQDRGVEPGLALVQAETALPEPEAFLHRPAQSRGPDQAGLDRAAALISRGLPFRPPRQLKPRLDAAVLVRIGVSLGSIAEAATGRDEGESIVTGQAVVC